MHTKHAKSLCCQAQLYRWGKRRRRCARCRRTWSIRPRRRGARPRRLNPRILSRVLLQGQRLRELRIWYPGRSVQAIGHRFRRMLKQLARSPAPLPPGQNDLVLISDGLWFRFRGKRWILYLMALKPCDQNVAYFADPVVLPGNECARGWRKAFQTLPPELRCRIRAWVVDNVTGIRSLGQKNGWVVQLCHFHLISMLQMRRGHWLRSIPATTTREAIYQTIRTILAWPDDAALELQGRLRMLLEDPALPSRLRMIGREFLRRISYYRAYRLHPNLALPTTTSALESLGSLIRDRIRHARNLRTPESLRLWTTAFLRLRRSIICNGKLSTE